MSKDNQIKIVASVVLPYKEGFIYVKTAKDGKLGLPGGKIDSFEDIEVAAPREVSEEIGAEIVLERLLGFWNFESDRGSSVINVIYSGKIVEGKPHIVRPKEIKEIKSFKLSEIRFLYSKGKIRSGLANVRPVEKYLQGVNFPLNAIECLFKR